MNIPFALTLQAGGDSLSAWRAAKNRPPSLGEAFEPIKVNCALFLVSFAFFAAFTDAHAGQLRASDGAQGDSFGYGVSVSGDNALVGAYLDDVAFMDQGSAYLFNNLDSSNATQVAKLTASDPATQAYFGVSVSLQGSSALIGSYGKSGNTGAAYFFSDANSPTSVKLSASDGAANDQFGNSVSLSGNSALIGAFMDGIGGNTGQGSVYLFRNLNGPAPLTEDKLTAADGAANDQFGISVSLSGNRGLVGASGKGAAYLFNNLQSGTISQTKIIASDPEPNDQFGNSVSLSGNSALIGAYQNDSSKGAAYFIADLASPTVQVKLTAYDAAISDNFGNSVSLSGNAGLIGAPGDDSSRGAAYLFANSANSLAQVKLIASDRFGSTVFGGSVSLDGDRFLIGSYLANDPTIGSGKVYSGSVSSVTTLDIGNTSRTIDGISFVSRTDWVIGQTTTGNQVTLKQGNTADVTASGMAIYIGRNAGSNNNTLSVDGSVTANTVNISAPSGSTGNTLQIGNTGKVNAGVITVNSGGTLLLTGATGNDRIGNSTSVTVTNGGTLATSGLSEGASSPGSSPGIGALTLQGGATIDFATGQNGSTLLAASGLVSGAGVISILNWSGSAGTDTGAAGNDRLLFAADPMFSDAQLAQFQFYNDNNVAFAVGAIAIAYNGYYELTPVPEPATWLGGVLAASALVASFRRARGAAARLSIQR